MSPVRPSNPTRQHPGQARSEIHIRFYSSWVKSISRTENTLMFIYISSTTTHVRHGTMFAAKCGASRIAHCYEARLPLANGDHWQLIIFRLYWAFPGHNRFSRIQRRHELQSLVYLTRKTQVSVPRIAHSAWIFL